MDNYKKGVKNVNLIMFKYYPINIILQWTRAAKIIESFAEHKTE